MLIIMTLLLYNVWGGSRTTLLPKSSSELCSGNRSVSTHPHLTSTGSSITLSQLCRLFAATYTQASNCTSVAFKLKVDIFCGCGCSLRPVRLINTQILYHLCWLLQLLAHYAQTENRNTDRYREAIYGKLCLLTHQQHCVAADVFCMQHACM